MTPAQLLPIRLSMTAIHEYAEMREVAARLEKDAGAPVKLPSYDQVRREITRPTWLRTAHTFFPDLFARHTKQYFSRSHQAMRSLKLAQCLPHLLQHLLLFKVSELSHHIQSYPAC